MSNPTGRSKLLTLGGLLTVGTIAAFAWSACSGDSAPEPTEKTDPTAKKKVDPPTPQQEALEGGPYPTLLLSQAWFWKDENKKSKPGPARLEIWRQGPSGWQATRLEDGDSNVFHKAIQRDDGWVYTIGAEKALVKRWKHDGGKWASQTLWEKSWGGKFNRIRDLEFGDVDGDGEDEAVVATHDAGVVAVLNLKGSGPAEVVELDQKKDTFVHEIEIGDIDGDGKKEFFATPSDRNSADKSQHGEVVMYRFDGTGYKRSVVDPGEGTHAKEILCADIDGDGDDELFSVQEAVLENKRIVKPVEVREYKQESDGTFSYGALATIDDRQTRFLVPGDFDGDGQLELVAAAMKSGLYLLDRDGPEGTWTSTRFETDSSGFEHATLAADLDGDGKLELYVAADDQGELVRYTWDAEKKTFSRQLIGKLQPRVFTWNLQAARL